MYPREVLKRRKKLLELSSIINGFSKNAVNIILDSKSQKYNGSIVVWCRKITLNFMKRLLA